MKPTLWGRIEELFHQTLQLDSSRRSEFLERASAGDRELQAEVESLLEQEQTTGDFLETPALEVAARALAHNRRLLAGESLGVYRVLALLGTGGMSVVYKALHSELDQVRALKVLPPEISLDRARMRRFQREAKAVSRLDHPSIAKFYEVAEFEGVHFIALEYVEGENLAVRVARSRLTISEVIRIASRVAEALSHAHSKRVIHRDIKPSNIMISPDGEVKLLDFGLAKIKQLVERSKDDQSFSSDTLTQPGFVMGTIGYMSPEQLLGQDLDNRTDIFSLGVVTFKMATRRLPFPGKTITDQMDRILNAQPEALTRFNRQVPERLEAIVRKCLRKNRKERYRSCSELLDDLSECC